MYDTLLLTLVFYIAGLVIGMLLLYVVVRAAVTKGMKNTRWQVANRDEMEAKYAKRPAAEAPSERTERG